MLKYFTGEVGPSQGIIRMRKPPTRERIHQIQLGPGSKDVHKSNPTQIHEYLLRHRTTKTVWTFQQQPGRPK